MRRLIAMLLMVILLLTGCADTTPIKVAYVAGISGPMSELGVAGRNAFLLKVKDVNDAGGINGREVVAVIKDSASDPSNIPTIYNELREEGVEYVVGHIISSMAESVLNEASKEDILIISATMSTNLIDDKDDFLIRTAVSNSFQAKRMAKQLNDDGKSNIIVVTDQRNKTYTEEFAVSMAKDFMGTITKLPFDTSTETADAIYAAIEKDSPDAVLLITPAIETATLAQRIKQIEDTDLYSVSWSMSTDLITNGASAVEGMKIVYTDSNKLYPNKKEDFKSKYMAEYNEEAIFVADIVFEATDIMFTQMQNLGELTPLNLKNSLISQSFEGIEDNVVINQFGDRRGNYEIFIVENGEFKLLE